MDGKDGKSGAADKWKVGSSFCLAVRSFASQSNLSQDRITVTDTLPLGRSQQADKMREWRDPQNPICANSPTCQMRPDAQGRNLTGSVLQSHASHASFCGTSGDKMPLNTRQPLFHSTLIVTTLLIWGSHFLGLIGRNHRLRHPQDCPTYESVDRISASSTLHTRRHTL